MNKCYVIIKNVWTDCVVMDRLGSCLYIFLIDTDIDNFLMLLEL